MHLLDRWKNKQQSESARRLLQAEADSNLKLLQEWWDRIKPHKDEDEIHWVDKIVYARELADAALPAFSRHYLTRYQQSLSRYLRGAQVGRLERFYQDLGKLQEIQDELRDALEMDLALRRPSNNQAPLAGEASPKYENFLKVAPWSWREAARLVEEILTLGNPLGKSRTVSQLPSSP